MTTTLLNLHHAHPSWHECLQKGLEKINPNYLQALTEVEWLPGPEKIFNAFSIPVNQVRYVLFGESPYPRAASANGYAFWDNRVQLLWSDTGLSKVVNRATSLRNLIKMLLVAEGVLEPNRTTQSDIAHAPKDHLIHTNQELFQHLLTRGFLLLNASLVLQDQPVSKDAKAWEPFMQYLLQFLTQNNQSLKFVLFGNIANKIDKMIPANHTERLYAEHPYNHSFIHNPEVISFFKPLHLLRVP